MTLKKRPQKNIQAPDYPELKNAQIKRRRFLSLVGAAASASLLPSCYESDDGDLDVEPNDTDTEKKWDTENVAGGEVMPEFFSLRLPGEADRVLSYQEARATLTYVVWVQYEEPDFSRFVQEEETSLLLDIDKLLLGYSIYTLQTQEGVTQAAMDIDSLLKKAYEGDQGAVPGILRTRLDIINVDQEISTDIDGGDVAPEYYDDRIPTSGSARAILSGGSELEFVVWTQHEDYDFRIFLQSNMDRALSTIKTLLSSYNAQMFQSEDGMVKIKSEIQQVLSDLYKEKSGYMASIISIRLEVVKLVSPD